MCDCFHLAFPNWHAASSGTGAGRRLRGPEPGTEDDSTCDEPSEFREGERPRPQGSSPVEEYPEKYTDSDKECEAEHDPHHKSGSGKKTKKSGLGSMFEKRSTPKMSKLKEVHSPESGVIVKTAKDGCAEGLVYGGGGKEGIFIKEVVPESPASKSLKLKEGDQILSATVYFDNVSYEDAIQILEHAQAYKVKLCLKRKPDITETEPAIESDVIPEEDLYAPDMREQGKTKKRGDTRISWPKFPSFGKGKKSRFTRSHSSSEADEQRKLELSPTTSDTESPIKSQDALKGKKKHKMKLSVLTKRGRISSSEDQDTDAPTTGQISADAYQTASDMLSPEGLESLSGETPGVCVTEDLKDEPQTPQHKVELISIDSTLKTADLTVALADQESPSGIKSPDEKKKKKERSELKMKILGKDKSHKKDAKAKASPKRLKTLGASIDKADQPENEKSDVIPGFESRTEQQGDQLTLDANTQIISSESSRAKSVTTQIGLSVPKVELDISDVAFIRKSPQKDEEKTKKGKDKQKQETKTSTTYKLPKVGLGDIATEEAIQKINVSVDQHQTKIEQLKGEGTGVKEDPYDRLAKSRTQLPKREDIEIPGMEDMSMRTTAKGIKEPKAVLTGHYEEIQAETVQLSIDVDSVKEAVSKLPGYKLPKVDTSGVPIPEEITVIDANAQRISVKTPTKVVKHETHFTKFDVTSPEISKAAVKLPKITPADLTSEELLIETKLDLKKSEAYKRDDIIIPGKESAQEETILKAQETEKTQGTEGITFEYESAATFSPKETDKKSKKTKITMPSFGIAKPDIRIPDVGIDLLKHSISDQKGGAIKEDRTTLIQEVKTSKTETKKGKGQIGVTSDVKIPEIDSFEYIDSVGVSPAKKDGGIRLTGFGVNLDATKPTVDISCPEIRGEIKDAGAEEHTIKLPKYGVDADKDINIDGAEIKILEKEGKGSKFKIPNLDISMPKVKGPKIDLSLSKKDVDVTLPEAKAEIILPEAPEMDITLGSVDVSMPEQKVEIEKPQLQTEGELDGQGGKFKMPKLGIKMPKIKGPEFDLSLSKKDVEVTLPEAKAEVKLPDAPKVDVTLGSVDVSVPEQKMEVEKPELEIKPLQIEGELDGQGSKFKMPKLGITMPKVKGPEIDFSLSKRDVDVTLPEAKAEVKLPDVELKDPSAKVEIKAPEIKGAEKDVEASPSKFKMPTFKLPKFGAATPNVSIEVSSKTKDIQIPETQLKSPEVADTTVDITAPNIDIEGPSLDVKKTAAEIDGKGGKFKMPKFGISLPKVKGPEIDLSLSKKDVDVTLPEAEADVKLPDVEGTEPGIKVEVKAPEIAVHQKDIEASPSKFKMPTFKLPKLGVGTPNISMEVSEVKLPEAPEVDVSLGKADVSIPEEKLEVKKPEFDAKLQQSEVELDKEGSKFKLPKLGMSMPKVKGPEIHFGLSKTDGDITLPEAEAEVKVPEIELKEPFAKVEVKAPEIKVSAKGTEGSPSKFKMPTFKLPKFGVGTPNVFIEVPDMDKDVKIDGADINVPEEASAINIAAPSIDIEGPSIDLKTTGTELDGKGSKFKIPHLGFSKPKVKGPKIDLSLSKKDDDVKLPEVDLGKADVSIPEAKMEVKKPELDIQAPQTEGELGVQGEKFKMPKFGIKMPKLKGPEFDLSLSKKDVDVTLPEAKAEVKLPDAPKVDVTLGSVDVSIPEHEMEVEKPELEIKPLQAEGEIDGQGSKFKMPKFGIKMPKLKGPEFDLSLSKKDVDVTLPEAKAEVKLPDAPKVDVTLGSVDVSIPEQKMEVEKPELEIKPLETEVELDGQGRQFKMPKFGMSMPKVKGPEFHLGFTKKDVDVTLPEAKADVNLPDAELNEPSAKVEIKAPEIEVAAKDTQGSASKFKMPNFSFSMPKVKGPDIDLSLSKKDTEITLPDTKAEVKLPEAPNIDVSLGKAEVLIPETKVEVKKPEVQIKPLKTNVELEGQGGKFKMPKFGISMPKVKGPDIDISFSKKDVDVTLPEAKAETEIPEAPKIAVDVKPLECEAEIDGQGSKFKMPKFGITMPKVKGPEIDLSLSKKDAEVTLPEAKAEVKLPDVDLKEPSAKVEIKAPEIEAQFGHVEGSASKFKMPTFKLPKFGAATPNVSMEVPDVDKDLKVDGSGLKIPKDSATVDISAQNIDIEGPSLDVKMTGTEGEVKGSKFKVPKFGISLPKVQGPEIDLHLSKKDIDVKLPEAKAEVKLPEAPEIDVNLEKLAKMEVKKPELEIKPLQSEGELDGQGSKFKMPKFGISMPKVKGPEIDFSLSKKDAEVSLPEAKAEVSLPDVELKEPSAEVEVKAPEIEAQLGSVKGSPSKFKMPTFKFPKFGVSSPNISAEVPDIDKEIKIEGAHVPIPEPHIDVEVPEVKAEICLPEVEVKEPSGGVVIEQPGVEVDAKLKKPRFSLPRFSFSKPSVKAPEVDVTPQDVNIAIPEGKVEIKGGEVDMKLPEHEAEIDGQGGKFKMPKFGISMPKVKGPDIDISFSKKDVDVMLPEAKAESEIPEAPKIAVDVKPLECEAEIDGQGSKFKMPKFGISIPKVKGPEIDLSLSKKDVDVTLPEAKAEVKLPDVELKKPSAEVEIKTPEVKVVTKDTEGSPSKFKMPTFKLPKFGVGTPSAIIEAPDMDKDIKIDGADIKIPEEVLEVKIAAPGIDSEGPSIEIKTTGTEYEGKGSKFKLPSLGFSQVKGPDVDLSLSKKDVDVTLPEATADVQLPDVELKELSTKVDIKAPGIEVQTSTVEGSPSKFKMPTFKLPKFGPSTPQVSVEVPNVDKDIKVDGADLKLPEAKVEVKLPDVEIKEPVGSISVSQAPMAEGDAKARKTSWTLPRFSLSKPSVKGTEADLNLDTPKVDVTLPEGKIEVHPPDINIKESSSISVEGVPDTELDAKLKKPRFSLPKFSFSKQSTKDLEADVSLPETDVSLPKGNVEVKPPEVELKPPEGDVELDGKESKFKMPKFGLSMPKVKGPEIDLSLSKKDIDVTVPEAKAEVKLPDVKIKQPSAKVEMKSPEIETHTGNVEGSPSKLKMPTFTLPKFGAATPKVSAQVPDVDKDIKIEGAKLKIPKEGAKVDIKAPSIDTEGLSVDAKAKGSELGGTGSKFKMPHFGISMPKVKGPEIDLSLSKKDVDVTLPEAKADVKLPGVEVKQPSAEMEIKPPEVKVVTKDTEGSPSKFKMPTFKLPKFGVGTPSATVEVTDVNKDVKIDGADIKTPEEVLSVKIAAPSISGEGPSIEMKSTGTEHEGKGSKFKLPSLSFSVPQVKGPDVDLSLSKKDVDVTLPEAKADVQVPDAKLKEHSAKVEIKAPGIEVQTSHVEGSPSKFKMPTFKLPKFGQSTPQVSVEVPDMDKDIKVDGADLKLPEAKVEVKLPDVKIKQPTAKVEIKAPEIEAQVGNVEGSPSKLKLPTFTLPKFGVATPKVSAQVPDVDKDVKIDGVKLKTPKEGAKVDVKAPSIDSEGLSVDVKGKGGEPEGSGSKFKMPHFGISMPRVKGPEIDLSLSKKDVDVTLPEAKAEVTLPSVEVKEPEVAISVPDAPAVESEAKVKRPNWTFPKFSFSKTSDKADVDVNLEAPKAELTSPEAQAEVCLPDAEIKEPSGVVTTEEPPAAELDANLKKSKFSLPKFSFSKSSTTVPEVSAKLPHVDVSLPEGEVKVKQPETEIKTPEIETEHDVQVSKFKLPKFGIASPKAKGPEVDLNASPKDVGITLPEVKAEVKLPEVDVKESSASVDIEAKSKDAGGSPLKFKMPTLKMPKFGGASYDVTVESPDADKADTDGAKLKEDVTVDIKGLSVDIKTDIPKAATSDSEMQKTETDSVGHGSPSKFKLPSFKMPKLSFSRPKHEDEYAPGESEAKDDQLEMQAELKEETKSPKLTLTSFGEILKNIDVEFDVSKTDKVEDNLETLKEAHETSEPSDKQLEAKAKETNTKQDTTKSPERTGWFKFPRFGLSSPSEPAKISEKDKHKDEKSPVGETVDEEISPTCSVQSSDAFADISSTMTSEHVGLSLSSPTKVTVKYSDPNAATGLGEIHSNIITSTRTGLISVEPNLPEKITILSSGVSSSSEDTLRLESGKIHVITSNIQATPETQQAKLLTAVQVQSAGGLPLKSEANEAASWTVDDSQSGKRTVFERHLVRETSSERSESKETIVITKQITRIFDSSEPISGETATSIQRLRDSVHSEKMRFFDGAEK